MMLATCWTVLFQHVLKYIELYETIFLYEKYSKLHKHPIIFRKHIADCVKTISEGWQHSEPHVLQIGCTTHREPPEPDEKNLDNLLFSPPPHYAFPYHFTSLSRHYIWCWLNVKRFYSNMYSNILNYIKLYYYIKNIANCIHIQ